MTKYWIIGTGSGNSHERLWNDCLSNNRIRIGFEIDVDLSPYVASGKDEFTNFVNSVRDRNPGSARQCWDFAAEMAVGDKIVARKGRSTIVGLGEVTSDYLFDENFDDYRQFRNVDWFPFEEEVWAGQEFSINAVVELTEDNSRYAELSELLTAHDSKTSGGRYPLKSHSWIVFSPTVAVKQMDKSAFLHHGTGVPRDVSFFFDFVPERNAKSISLIHSGIHFEAQLSPDVRHNRVRLFWQSPMSKLIEELMPIRHQQYSSDEGGEIAPAEMRFCREADDVYSVEFLDPDTISKDAENADEEQTGAVPRREGTRRTVISTRIERDPQNRIDAIRIHGHRCVACDFDFGRVYGGRGEGYIEVHHLTPLADVDEGHTVNPETDLAPVCANCHRMIHRRRSETLSLDELKEMIRSKAID